MKLSVTTVRRGLYGIFAGGLLGGVTSAAFLMPVANAAPGECTASGVADTVSSVTASTSAYLLAYPQTDQALTEIAQRPVDEAQEAYRNYFTNNPQITEELKTIHQPVTDLVSECGLELTPTPITEALRNL